MTATTCSASASEATALWRYTIVLSLLVWQTLHYSTWVSCSCGNNI